jgi:O-antigen/teichoic acid export membrane protein
VPAELRALVEGLPSVRATAPAKERPEPIDEPLPPFSWRQLGSNFSSQVAGTLATRFVLLGVGVATTVVVARELGPEGRGLYAVAAAVGAFGIQFGNFGLQTSNTYYVSKDRSLLPRLVGNTVAISSVAALGSALAWLLFALWPALAPVRGLLLVLSLAWIPIGLSFMLFRNLLLGLQEVRAYNLIELVARLGGLALIGIVITARAITVVTVFAAVVGTAAASTVWAGLRLRRHLTRRPTLSWSVFALTARYGLRAYLGAFFGFCLLRADLLLVKYMRGATEAGYYSIAVGMADALYILPAVVGIILFPRLAAMSSVRLQWQFATRIALFLGALMIVAALASSLVAGPAVRLLFGDEFQPATPAFVVLAIAMIFYGTNNVVSSFAAAFGYPWAAVHMWALGALFNVALNLLLVPPYGIVGSAVASLVCYGLVLAVQGVYFTRKVSAIAS